MEKAPKNQKPGSLGDQTTEGGMDRGEGNETEEGKIVPPPVTWTCRIGGRRQKHYGVLVGKVSKEHKCSQWAGKPEKPQLGGKGERSSTIRLLGNQRGGAR